MLADRPDLDRARLERVRALMDLHVDEALVEGYRQLIPNLTLPDPDDRHVLAAAIRGRVERIVTFNVRDFPDTILGRYRLQAQHPDRFIGELIGRAPHLVVAAARRQRSNLRRPAVEAEAFVARLGELGLEGTAHFLEGYLDSL